MPLPLLVGEFRAGGDADLRFLPDGRPVATFSAIASSAKKLEDGSWETTAETPWLRINCWGPLAEPVAEAVTKGCKVFIAGKLSQRKFEVNGEERVSQEVRADAVQVIPKRDDAPSQPRQSSGGASGDPWGGPAATQTDEPPF